MTKDTTAKVNLSPKICNWILKTSRTTLIPKEIYLIKLWRDTNQEPHIDELESLSYNNALPVNSLIANVMPHKLQLPKSDNIKDTNKFSKFLKLTIIQTESQRNIVDYYRLKLKETSIPYLTKYQNNLKNKTVNQVADEFLNYFHIKQNEQYSFSKLRAKLNDYGFIILIDNYVPMHNYNYKNMPLNSDEFKGFTMINNKQLTPIIFINENDLLKEQLQVLLRSVLLFMDNQSVILTKDNLYNNSKINQIIKLILKRIHYQFKPQSHLKMDYELAFIVVNLCFHVMPLISFTKADYLLNTEDTTIDNLVKELQTTYGKLGLPRIKFANEIKIGQIDK